MALDKIGINFDLSDIEPINITVPETKEGVVNWFVDSANSLTNNLIGLFTSVTVFVFLYWYMSDISQFGDFRYSKIRTVAISSCIVSIMGLMMLYLGFYKEFFHIAVFIVVTMIFTIWVAVEESN